MTDFFCSVCTVQYGDVMFMQCNSDAMRCDACFYGQANVTSVNTSKFLESTDACKKILAFVAEKAVRLLGLKHGD